MDTAKRYLVGAHQSVSGLLETFDTFRELRRKERSATLGDSFRRMNWTSFEIRAAVAFSGAGIDATLKQLMRDRLPMLLERDAHAQD